ncbi:hypothetical protein QN219_22915 [Sinorhizobium sp. 7-81]|uniref:hypothetical protein n=1 Tax=Sinorhizobium sp. 8-89 TaxID=3049089 RepID=UPI0024C4354D|nr:hypothetical protein [Sinorhizobium sp. 8-89]MDK1492877.1 hypothetical protein [Sinorhizobium sp. 8-89]
MSKDEKDPSRLEGRDNDVTGDLVRLMPRDLIFQMRFLGESQYLLQRHFQSFMEAEMAASGLTRETHPMIQSFIDTHAVLLRDFVFSGVSLSHQFPLEEIERLLGGWRRAHACRYLGSVQEPHRSSRKTVPRSASQFASAAFRVGKAEIRARGKVMMVASALDSTRLLAFENGRRILPDRAVCIRHEKRYQVGAESIERVLDRQCRISTARVDGAVDNRKTWMVPSEPRHHGIAQSLEEHLSSRLEHVLHLLSAQPSRMCPS